MSKTPVTVNEHRGALHYAYAHKSITLSAFKQLLKKYVVAINKVSTEAFLSTKTTTKKK